MSKSETTRRYVLYFIGIYFVAMGLALIITSGLGTSPISTWAYVMSRNTPLTVGTYTFIINMAMVTGQILILRHHGLRKQKYNILLQIPFSFIFSAFIDTNVFLARQLFSLFQCESAWGNYGISLAFLAIGCLIQSYGVLLEVRPGVTMMSAEAFVYYICGRWEKEFGTMKVGFDVSMVSLAALFGLGFTLTPEHIADKGILQCCLDGILGSIREGTVIAALSVGRLVKLFARHAGWMDRFMMGKSC